MLLALLLAVVMGHPHTDCMCYMYVNRDSTQQVYIGQHMFESLVKEKWCVKVYERREDGKTIHVCEI
jgi:hypothetical protein